MTTEKFIEVIATKPGNEVFSFIQQFGKNTADLDLFAKQYDPTRHDVMNPAIRKDDDVYIPTNEKDEYGNIKLNPDGTPLTMLTTEPVARIAISAQQDITDNAAAILCTNPVILQSDNEDEVADLEQIWKSNRMEYDIVEMCRIWLSETEIGLLWYKNDDNEFKSMILANSLGDKLYPVFDNKGKMIVFARSYTSQEVDDTTLELKDVTFVEVYTDTEVYKADDTTGGLVFDTPVKHQFKKIPVSYATRLLPVWANAQIAISRSEETISNLCDTNEYNGSPILFGNGQTFSLPPKGKRGKYIEGDKDAKLSLISNVQMPEPVKLELDLLEKQIENSCKYVNLSIEKLKGLFGSAPSSYAIKLLFTPAHGQAKKHERVFGVFLQRAINILLTDLSLKPDSVTPKFEYLLPRNEQEEVATIVAAKNGGFLSEETSVEISPLTQDADKELKRVQAEQTATDAKALAQAKVSAAAAKVNGVPNPVS